MQYGFQEQFSLECIQPDGVARLQLDPHMLLEVDPWQYNYWRQRIAHSADNITSY